MQHWMDSVPGQTFLNYAYSWGASIVILGTLFKLTHLQGANLMLFIGMGTEVFVFFLSAFDRPFDKAEINRELSDELPSDEEISQKMSTQSSVAPRGAQGGGFVIGGGVMPPENGTAAEGAAAAAVSGAPAGVVGGGGTTVIIGSGSVDTRHVGKGETFENVTQPSKENEFEPSAKIQAAAEGAGVSANSLVDIIRMANEELLRRAQASMTPELEQASKEYAEKLKLLTETLDKVEKQSSHLTTDSEEMTNLNRTLTGINTVYELQLKSVSKQVGSIERINEQTHHMAEQIEELNGIYARMIKALTVNMKNAVGPNT